MYVPPQLWYHFIYIISAYCRLIIDTFTNNKNKWYNGLYGCNFANDATVDRYYPGVTEKITSILSRLIFTRDIRMLRAS